MDIVILFVLKSIGSTALECPAFTLYLPCLPTCVVRGARINIGVRQVARILRICRVLKERLLNLTERMQVARKQPILTTFNWCKTASFTDRVGL